MNRFLNAPLRSWALWSLAFLLPALAHSQSGGEGRVCGTRMLAMKAVAAPSSAMATKPTSFLPAQIDEITVGTQLEFPVSGLPVLLPATCQHVGEHAFVFVEDTQWDTNGGSVLQSHVDGIAELFNRSSPADPDRGVYELASQAFGKPPDVDGHDRIFILILDISDPVFIGFFDPAVATHPVPELRRDVLYLDERAVRRSGYLARGTLAHEFQHLIHWGHDADEEDWINEGLSGYAEELTGYPEADPDAVPSFLNQPDVDFTNWPLRAFPAYYGSTYLLMSFLAERFGQPFIRDLVAQQRNGRFGVDDAFDAVGIAEDFDSAWGQWVVANYTHAIDGSNSYRALGARSPITFPVEELPLVEATGHIVGQWGTATLLFRTPGDLSVSFGGGDDGRFSVWAQIVRPDGVGMQKLSLDAEGRGQLTVTGIDSLALIVGKTSFQGGDYTVSANRPSITAVAEPAGSPVPTTLLATPFPNPFNRAVTIRFAIDAPEDAQLAVYSINGHRVRAWNLSDRAAGEHELAWDGLDDAGRAVASGTYTVQLKTGSRVESRRFTHLK